MTSANPIGSGSFKPSSSRSLAVAKQSKPPVSLPGSSSGEFSWCSAILQVAQVANAVIGIWNACRQNDPNPPPVFTEQDKACQDALFRNDCKFIGEHVTECAAAIRKLPPSSFTDKCWKKMEQCSAKEGGDRL